jgi:hypothetical protein
MSKPRMTFLQRGEDYMIMKSLDVDSKTSNNDQVLSAGNVMKISNI